MQNDIGISIVGPLTLHYLPYCGTFTTFYSVRDHHSDCRNQQTKDQNQFHTIKLCPRCRLVYGCFAQFSGIDCR